MRRFLLPAAMLLTIALVPSSSVAQDATMQVTTASALQWGDLDVPGFDPGMMIAVVHGDPAVGGEPYTIRLKFPDGYRFPAHWHPTTENLTVLSGMFLLAMEGEETGELVTYAPGDYLYIPPRNAHSGGATGETVIQLHGTGPFEINLGKPMGGTNE